MPQPMHWQVPSWKPCGGMFTFARIHDSATRKLVARGRVPLESPTKYSIQRLCSLNLWNQYFAGTSLAQPIDFKDWEKTKGEWVPLASPQSLLGTATRQSPRANACRVAIVARLQVIADIPERAVITRIQRQRRVVLPAQRVRLRGLPIGKNRLVQRHRARLVTRQPRGETLTSKRGAVAEGVTHCDIALAVHPSTRHPTETAVRRIRSLLRQLDGSLIVDRELVPPHATPARAGIHRVRCHNELLRSEIAINKTLHQLVTLRVKTSLRARLRHTLRKLPIAKVVIRSDRNLLRSIE